MHKVLIDLSIANASGQIAFTGIPQDSRLQVKTLSRVQDVDMALFAYGVPINHNRKSTIPPIHQAARDWANFLQSEREYSPIRLLRIVQKATTFLSAGKKFFQKSFSPVPMDVEHFPEMLWERFLSYSLEPEDIHLARDYKFFVIDASNKMLNLRSRLNLLPTFDFSDYDFVIFQEMRTFKLKGNTRKIVRYHDAIPALWPQYTPNRFATTNHLFKMEHMQDAYFACNSRQSAEQALLFMPFLEKRISVIPCTVPEGNKPNPEPKLVPGILASNMSRESCQDQRSYDQLTTALLNNEKETKKNKLEYILAVSTIEPRKNYNNLIQAWHLYRQRTGRDVKLVIVGSMGWLMEQTLRAMRPHINTGNIIHVSNVPITDLRILYSCALALFFASKTEGFGFSPIEAMQCDCPAVVSDIPIHREIAGDAALYFNPYSVQSIADAMEHMLAPERYPQLRQEMVVKGRQQASLYTHERAGALWLEMFDRLKSGRPLDF